MKNAHIDDMVFENRNKSYGAYLLRRLYDNHMRNALLVGILLFLLIVAIPLAKSMIDDPALKKVDTNIEVTLELTPSIDMDKILTPQPISPVEPPVLSKPSIKFSVLEIREDNVVNNETTVPSQDDVNGVKIGTETQKGDINARDLVEVTFPPDIILKDDEKPKEDEKEGQLHKTS